MKKDKETWKPIPGFDGYDVSDLGRVRSYRAREKGRGGATWHVADEPQRILSPGADGGGYLLVTLAGPGGKQMTRNIAPLVLLAFVGPRPKDQDVCHTDGNKLNNRLDNLRYDTRAGNAADKTGQAHNVTLTTEQVVAIREERATGKPLRQVARESGIPRRLVARVCWGQCYQDVGGPITQKSTARRKLSDKDVKAIKELCAAGDLLQREIAKMFGVSNSTISLIKRGIRRA